MKIREAKPDDQDQAEKAFSLMEQLVKNNPEIEPSIWVSACLSSITQSFLENGIDYKDYFDEMLNAIISYKSWWEEN